MKKIVDCKPVGNFILIEQLSAQEVMGTKIHIEGEAKVDVPQAIILDIGCNVDVARFGFKVGDRVIVQGTFVPVPQYGDGERKRGLLDPHAIKGIVIEADE